MKFRPAIAFKKTNRKQILYFASAYVQVPEAQIASGTVRGSGLVDREWFTVSVSSSEPSDAWVKVNYRGHWFYIADNDLQSRTSFGLLDALFESVVGNVPGAKPLLTLPVK